MKYLLFFAIVRQAIRTPNTPIAARKHHTTSTNTKLGEHVTDGGGIILRNGLLVLSVRGCEGLGNRQFTGDGFEPVKVRLVVVVCWMSGWGSAKRMGKLEGPRTYLE